MRDFVWKLSFVRGIGNYILQTIVVAVMTYFLSLVLAYMVSWLPKSEYIIGCHQKK